MLHQVESSYTLEYIALCLPVRDSLEDQTAAQMVRYFPEMFSLLCSKSPPLKQT